MLCNYVINISIRKVGINMQDICLIKYKNITTKIKFKLTHVLCYVEKLCFSIYCIY